MTRRVQTIGDNECGTSEDNSDTVTGKMRVTDKRTSICAVVALPSADQAERESAPWLVAPRPSDFQVTASPRLSTCERWRPHFEL